MARDSCAGPERPFFVTGALFWLYFGEMAKGSMRTIAESEDPGSLARDAYKPVETAFTKKVS